MAEDFSQGPVAENIYEADRNASNLNGRDPEGFRHRGNFVEGGELPYVGSLQDAQDELRAAHLSQGDYLDFGPAQVGGARFAKWRSVTQDQQSDRGIVVRIALLCNLIPTSKELALAGFFAGELRKRDDTFKNMTAKDMERWIQKQRDAAAGTPEGGASGDSTDSGMQLDALGGGGRK